MAKAAETEQEKKLELTEQELQDLIETRIKEREQELEKEKELEREKEKQERENKGEDLVTVRLFKDSNQYKEDVVVVVNGKAWQIKRGVDVEVPRFVAEVIRNSMLQDEAAADYISEKEEEFRKGQALQMF